MKILTTKLNDFNDFRKRGKRGIWIILNNPQDRILIEMNKNNVLISDYLLGKTIRLDWKANGNHEYER